MSEGKGVALSIDDRRTTEQLRALLDALPDELLLLTPDRRVVAANARVRERIGEEDPAVKRLSCYEVHQMRAAACPPQESDCLVDAVLRRGELVRTIHRTVDDFGNAAETDALGIPIFDESGAIIWIAQILRELRPRATRPSEFPSSGSPSVEAENPDDDRQVEDIRNFQTLGALTEQLAHKINNLMVGVISNVDYLLETVPVDSPIRECLGDIADSSQRAVALTRQMTDYAGKHFVEPTLVNLNDAARNAVALCADSQSKHIEFRTSLAEALPSVEGDAAQLQHGLLNLVSNAVSAVGAAPGIIEIRTGTQVCNAAYLAENHPGDNLRAGTYAFVEVTDDGVGMTPKLMGEIFNPFFSTKSPRHGLGLAAVLGIARNAGGTVEVFSEPGEGSTFRLLFPVPRHDATAPYGPGSTDSVQRRIPTVLVVDDEKAILNVAEQMISYMGYHVKTAAGGTEAEHLLQSDPDVDLVLLDYSMPGMDGESCFRALLKIKPDIIGVLSSGHSEQDLMPRFEGSGLSGYIQKPYRLEQLEDTIVRALNAKGH